MCFLRRLWPRGFIQTDRWINRVYCIGQSVHLTAALHTPMMTGLFLVVKCGGVLTGSDCISEVWLDYFGDGILIVKFTISFLYGLWGC